MSTWPLALLHALGAVLGWLTWLLSPTYRRRFAENARQAGYRFAEVRPAVAEAGKLVAETPRLWFGRTPAIQWENDD
jgi:KDO2-lipid IV(A) lauroyltransferase